MKNTKSKIIEIEVPEYNIESKPNYLKIGKKVDRKISKSLPDGKYILRAIGSQDHPKYNLDQLVNLILTIGTDKYDKKRKDVCHDDFSGYDYDIQAGTCEIKNGKFVIDKTLTVPSEFGDIVYHFYEHTPLDRGYPVRIDILMFYKPNQLMQAQKISPKSKECNDNLEKYLYKFLDSDNKTDALAGIVKIK